MEVRRLIIEVDGQGGIQLSHDNFSGAEMATMALILQDRALATLKNVDPSPVQIEGPAQDGATGDISESGEDDD